MPAPFRTYWSAVVSYCINYPTVLKSAEGVAADNVGNIYISQLGVSTILKITPSFTTSTIGSGFSSPYQMTMDSSQNLYVADSGLVKVVKIPTTGGTQSTVPFTGILSPHGVTVDSAGDVFVTSSNNTAPTVTEYNQTTKVQTTYSLSTTLSPAGVVSSPQGIALDAAGDLFIMETGNQRLIEFPASVGWTLPAIQLAGVGGSGNSVQVNPRQEIIWLMSNGLFSLQNGVGNFYGVSVGSTSKATVITYTFPTAVTLGTVPVVFSSNNSTTAQFKDAGGTDTCTTKKAMAANSTCIVNVEFAPTQAGVITGAVTLVDSTGNTLAITYLTGVGDGPVAAFSPGTQSAIASNLGTPAGVAVDSAGNTYLADSTTNTVTKISSAGVSATLAFTGLARPYGVAVDGMGAVYVSDSINNAVYKLTAAGVQSTVSTAGLSVPKGIALDGLNNLYIADSGNKRVVRIDSFGKQTTPAFTGLSNSTWVATDPAGDVFVSDSGAIYEIPFAGAQKTIAPAGLSAAAGIAVGTNGSLFVADSGNGDVLVVPVTGSPFPVASGLKTAAGIAMSSTGNLYISDSTGAQLVLLDRTKDTITFPATADGAGSAPLTATVQNIGNSSLTYSALAPSSQYALETPALATDCTATTILVSSAVCNVDIVFSPTTLGSVPGTVTLTDNALNATGATQTITLAGAGPTMTLSSSNASPVYGTPFNIVATITPTSGTFTTGDPVTFTVDSNAPVTELLSSGGVATYPTPTGFAAGQHTIVATFNGDSVHAVTFTITVAKYQLAVSAQAQTRQYGVANAAFVASYSTLQYADTASVLTGAPNFISTAGTTSDPGIYPITVTLGNLTAANYTFVAANSTITVTQAANAITFPPIYTGNSVVYGAPSATPNASATSALPIAYSVVSGPVTLSGGNTFKISGVGTAVVQATQAGNTDYAAATPVNYTFTITPALLTVTATSLSKTQGSANPALASTITGYQYADTVSVVSGAPILATTATTTSPTGTYPITCATGTLSAANYTFSCVGGTLTITGTTAQTITFPSLGNIVYGQPAPTLGATAVPSALAVSYAVTGPASVSAGNALTIAGIGQVCVTASQAGNATYAGASAVTNCFTITPATLTVTVANVNINYASPNAIPAIFNYSITGYVYSDTSGAVSGKPTITTTALTTSPVGTYPITAVQGSLSAANYVFAYVPGTLTISADPQQITFGALPGVTYGQPPIPLTASANSGLTVTYAVTTPLTASVSGSVLTILGAGQVCVTASQAGNTTTAAATDVPQCFTVSPAALTVTANNAPISYNPAGNVIPAFTYTITGFVYSDTTSVVSGAPAITTTATSTSPGGTYPITPTLGTLTASNYTFTTFLPAVLTIGQIAQTITFGALPNVPQTSYKTPISLTATASSGLAITYTATGLATVDNIADTLTFTNVPGTVTVTATQSGNADYLAAAPVTQSFSVTGTTSTALTLSTPEANLGSSVTLTAKVTGSITGSTPTGTVTFFAFTTQLGSPVTMSSGSATLNTTAIPSGTEKITAVYSGDGNFSSSTSSVVSVLIIAPDFVTSASNTNLTIAAGQTGSTTITLTPVGGYSYVVNFACGSLPSILSCGFNPPALGFSAYTGSPTLTTPQSTVLTITAAATTGKMVKPYGRELPRGGLALACMMGGIPLLGLSLWCGRSRHHLRRSMLWSVLLLLSIGGVIGISGCGSTSSAAAGTYNIPVNLTDGTGVVRSITITVTVTP